MTSSTLLFNFSWPIRLGALGLLITALGNPQDRALADANLLKNGGFEVNAAGSTDLPDWSIRPDSVGKPSINNEEHHSGKQSLIIPANTAIEQRVDAAPAGAYIARGWIKSERDQSVTLLLQDPEKPWAAYTCQETKVPAGKWVPIEIFCSLPRSGALSLTVGGMSKEFRMYHGTSGEMTASVCVDDFELTRFELKSPPGTTLAVWDGETEPDATPRWAGKDKWKSVNSEGQTFAGTPVVQARQLASSIRKTDGALLVYNRLSENKSQARCVVVPSPALDSFSCSMTQSKNRYGIRVSSKNGDRGYTAWFSTNGLITVEPNHVSAFKIDQTRLRYALLPSFVGSDICYRAAKLNGKNEVSIPSTQWLVGLADGNDSMLVTAWESDQQPVKLGLRGEGQNRFIDSLSIGTETNGFSISFVEHPGIWHQQALKEDWLGEYVPSDWKRPFPARWMGQFFISPGGRPSFREPYMEYSFPIAATKTRMWGVWFEDWNHYPFFFDNQNTMLHFEKTFVPNGEALFYFLEPAAAEVYSPVEIVEAALGAQKAAALFDYDANQLRKLKYSTPDQFMYDRPVCATTTRLSKIKKEEKSTVGINLATHLYEFIREIRARVDQYDEFFKQTAMYLGEQKAAHSELRDFIAELESMVSEAQSKTKEIHATPLSEVQRKIDGIKQRLETGGDDGFDCAELDVRSPAGAQDDLCRRYNRVVQRLTQTAALKCDDSPQKAVIAKHLWDEGRAVLRRPTRWEPRRTLYFFEP